MPGVIYRALSKSPYDFSLVATGASQNYTVAKGIDVSAYREATMLFRLHGLSISNSTPSIVALVYAEAPTTEDPANDFIVGSSIVTSTIVLSSILTAPQLTVVSIPAPFGSFLRIKVQGNQPAAVAPATLFVVALSIDIVAKS